MNLPTLGPLLAAADLPTPALTSALLPDWLDPEVILTWLGPWALIGVMVIIFAECGLLVGFFLPGDSLLFVTGMFIATGAIQIPLWLALVLLGVVAFIGNITGYWIGRGIGPRLFNKPDSRLFKQSYVTKTHEFFEKYGPVAIILARFVPIVRTFITATAGVARMDARKFALYSAIGALPWAVGLTWLGYLLGNVGFVRENIELIAIGIVLVSVIPFAIAGGKQLLARRNSARQG